MLYKSMDVGVDTNNFKPYSFAQIKNIMDSVNIPFSEIII
jgi:calcineurin-like phosphoesterase family protein